MEPRQEAAGEPEQAVQAPDQSVHARGPLRPPELWSVRERQGKRLASHMFRAVDVVLLAVLTGVWLEWVTPGSVVDAPAGVVAPFVLGAIVLAHMLRVTGMYRFERDRGLARHAAEVAVTAAATGAVVALAVGLLGGDGRDERGAWWWTVTVAGALVVLHTARWVRVHRWRAEGWLTPNIVLVGATSRADQLITEALARRDLHVLGIFDDRLGRSPEQIQGVPVLGDTRALIEHRVTPHVDLIVVTVDPTATARVREITSRLSVLPNRVTLFVDQDDEQARLSAMAQLANAPLAPVGRVADPDRRAFAKRVQDLAIAIPALLLAAPCMALIALAIKLDSPGPVFFRQRRHGFNNEAIRVFKFRSMRNDAADARAERQVTAGDDRVTRVGRILRSTSLDEVPQLINVIRGEMSLVGPRPHAIGMKTGDVESAQLVAEYAHRHRIRPGMTGWAAINGSRGPLHNPAEVKRRVALDVEYIERQSLWLDLKIMLLTIPKMLGDRGAVR